jgi:peptidoglycan hydrolase-like protein with peptidoglycan-binding domain
VRNSVRTVWAGALLAAALVLPGCGAVPAGEPGGTVTEPAPSPSAPTSAGSADTPSPSASPSAATKPATTKKAAAKPRTKPALVLAKGAKGEKVRDLQVRLRDLDWYAGSITGTYGKSTVTGVKGFQGKRGLKKTGNASSRRA